MRLFQKPDDGNLLNNTNIAGQVLHDILEKQDFQIYNKEEIYKLLLKVIYEIYNETQINKKYTLDHFLKNYDTQRYIKNLDSKNN